MAYFSALFSAPVLTNIMLLCFVSAMACMAITYQRQINRLQKQNERLIAGVQQILLIAETMAEPDPPAE
ncbi:MAG: hypothetical protein AB7E52_05500 [Bdellovibrionales bacterium]